MKILIKVQTTSGEPLVSKTIKNCTTLPSAGDYFQGHQIRSVNWSFDPDVDFVVIISVVTSSKSSY
jgi:hypothetical protein